MVYFVMILVQLEGLLHIQKQEVTPSNFFYQQNLINFVVHVPK